MKALIVDDDDDIRTIGRLSLGRVGGMQVIEAASGPEGLAVAARERPDVVLLDVMMPGMDGAAVYARLRELPETAATPVVFMTAKVQRHEVERLMGLGAVGVIAKPFDPMTLADEVRRLLTRSPSP
ncbi:MAG: response regulator [Myxococcota bacterium]